jgi:putative sterol carrier protein
MSAEAFFNKINSAAEAAPDVATSIDAIFQFDISGDGGGTYVLNLKSGRTKDFLSVGPSDDAQVKISVAGSDWQDMLDGKLDAMAAFMGGKIKLDGDMSLAMKLPKILKMGR